MKALRTAVIISGLLFCNTALSVEKSKETDSVETEKMVVTATMSEKIIKDAPGAIEVITEQDIIELNAETLADALTEAAGLVVTTESGRINAPSIRGTGNKHTLLLIDGRRITSGFKDMSGLEQIPVDLISRIEVVRGPASALYGSDAIGGVVNIITKKPSETLTAGGKAGFGRTTYGEGDEYKGSFYAGNTVNRSGFILAGGYRDRDGYDLDGVTPDDSDSINMKSLGGRFSYDIDSNHHLLTGFEAVDRDFSGLRDLQNMDRKRDMNDKRLSYFMEYNGKITPLSSVMLLANRSEHENSLAITPAVNAVAGAVGDESDSERAINQFEGRYTGLLFEKHLLTMGTEYVEEERKDASGMDNEVDTLSFYVQDEYRITDPLYSLLSLRWDEYSDYGSEWTPRISLTYSIKDNFRLKASYGRGFRAPDFLELFVPTYMRQGKEIYEPNPELKAESSESYEMSIEGEIRDFQGRLTWFDSVITDMIDAVYYTSTGSGKSKKDYYRYRNISEASMAGLEFEGSLRLRAGFSLTGNLAYLETEDKTTGKELEGKPDYKGSLKLSYGYIPMGIRGNLRMTYMGERHYSSGVSDHATLFGAYFSKAVTRNFSIYTGADNIFNKDDYGNPRYFYGGIRISIQ